MTTPAAHRRIAADADPRRTRRIHRYLLRCAGLWLILLLAAVAFVAVGRHYGARIASSREALSRLAEARTLHAQGAVAACEDRLLLALRLHPPVAEELVGAFREDLVGLPRVSEDLYRRLRENGLDAPPETRAYVAVVNNDRARAERFAREAPPSSEIHLWMARWALREGRLEDARGAFDRYWFAQPAGQNARTAAELEPTSGAAGDYYAAGRRLFELGLWDSAFAAFAEARKRGAAHPDLEYYRGLRLELDGKPEEARRVYHALADRFPQHRGALLRLRALEPTN